MVMGTISTTVSVIRHSVVLQVSLLKSIWLRSYAQTLAYSDSQLATKDAMRVSARFTK